MKAKLENNQLTLTLTLGLCKGCQRPIFKGRDLTYWQRKEAEKVGTLEESYKEYGICTECFQNLTYPTTCDLCGKVKTLPKDFIFRFEFLPKYGDGMYYEHVCAECVETCTKDVLFLFQECSDFIRIGK